MVKLSKNAQIQISLSWIFMIVIGTFFIGLSYNIIGKYKDIETQKFDIQLKQTLRTILNNAGRTSGIEDSSLIPLSDQITKKSIFQNKRVEILCENNLPIFSMNDNLDPNNNFLKNYPTFMTIIDEKDVSYSYLAVESFKMPFKITNLLAFVSKKNLIIFDEDSKISEKLIDKFLKSYPELTFKKKKFSELNLQQLKEEIKLNSYSSIVFVSDNLKNLGNINLNDFDIYSSHVEINQKGLDGNYGSIQITDKTSNKIFNYIDFDNSLSLITMAIFSKKETFDCSYNLIKESIIPIYSYYINKTSYLENSNKEFCSSLISVEEQKNLYSDFKISLNQIQTKISKSIKNNENINKDESLYPLLVRLNAKLLRLEDFNCPYIY